jgi:hypothetical protein
MDKHHLIPPSFSFTSWPSFKMNQQVFGATPDAGDPSPPQALCKAPGERDAQILAPCGDAQKAATLKHGGKPPAHRLNLWEFRHDDTL